MQWYLSLVLIVTSAYSRPAHSGIICRLLLSAFPLLARSKKKAPQSYDIFRFRDDQARELGLERPNRDPTPKLHLPDPNSLPIDVFYHFMHALGNRQNWGDVAHRGSNIKTEEQQIRAEWMRDDTRMTVNELMAQLTPEQEAIVLLAWEHSKLGRAPGRGEPKEITLEWVQKNIVEE